MLEWFISFLFLFTGQSNNLRVFIGLREILFIWYRCLLLGLIFMTHVILIDTHVLIYWYYTYSNTVANADIEKSTALNISSADILQRVALWAPPIGYSLQGVYKSCALNISSADTYCRRVHKVVFHLWKNSSAWDQRDLIQLCCPISNTRSLSSYHSSAYAFLISYTSDNTISQRLCSSISRISSTFQESQHSLHKY